MLELIRVIETSDIEALNNKFKDGYKFILSFDVFNENGIIIGRDYLLEK